MGLAKVARTWKCDNCGFMSEWGPNWRSRLILHKGMKSGGPWDGNQVACSDKCAEELDEGRKRINREI